MKKIFLTNILTAIICITTTATAAYVYTARDIGYSPSDENWNVTNADQALTSLKDDLNTVNTNVTEYKQQITEALADKGVNVDENSTMEDITSGISNFKSGIEYPPMTLSADGVDEESHQGNMVYTFRLGKKYTNVNITVSSTWSTFTINGVSYNRVGTYDIDLTGLDTLVIRNRQYCMKLYTGFTINSFS